MYSDKKRGDSGFVMGENLANPDIEEKCELVFEAVNNQILPLELALQAFGVGPEDYAHYLKSHQGNVNRWLWLIR